MTKQVLRSKAAVAPDAGRFAREILKPIADEDWGKVEELSEASIEATPECAEAWFAFAIAAFYKNDLAAAALRAEKALAHQGDAGDVADFLSVIYALAGDINGSTYYAKLVSALSEVPDFRGMVPETFPKFAKVFQNITERPLVHFGLHAVERKAWAEAENWFRQHLAFDPKEKYAHVGLAMSICAQGEPRGGVEALRAARHALPHDPDIASQLGNALTTLGRFVEGQACHRWAMSVAPDDAGTHAMAVVDRHFDPNARSEETADAFRQWGERFAVPDDGEPAFAKPQPKERLTVGYVVSGQGNSPSGLALAKVLMNHDPERYQTTGFGLGALSDAQNIVFQKCVSRWHDVAKMDPITLGAIVAAEEVDVLIDLGGFHKPDLLVAFGARMAPCQATWSGAPLGTGLRNMDFMITDGYLDANPAMACHMTEELAHLALGSILVPAVNDLTAPISEPDHAEVTFAADANLMELNVPTVECWARVLHRVADAKLILKGQHLGTGDNLNWLIELFGDFGVAHRVDIVSEEFADEFFQQGHVALLPLPMPRPQSVIDALRARMPVVCLAGTHRDRRQAASLLHHMDLGDTMVAENEDDFVDLAVEWAENADKRRAFRAEVADRLMTSPGLDANARARDLERLIEDLWRHACERS